MPLNTWPHTYKHLWRKLNSLIAWLDQAQAASTALSWAAEQCTALVSLCTRQGLSAHVGANKAAFKWVSRHKTSFMQDFCLGIFLWECLKKRKEHDFSFLQKANPLEVLLGLVIRHHENTTVGMVEASTTVSHLSSEIAGMLCFHSLCALAFSPHCCILGRVPGEPNNLPLWLDIGQQFCLCHTEEFWFV